MNQSLRLSRRFDLALSRRLSAGDIQTIVGGKPRYRALIHKRIPIHSVGVEILPIEYRRLARMDR